MSRLDVRMADGASRLEGEVPGPEAAPAYAIDAARILATIRRQRWVVLGWLLLMGVLGVAYLATTPRTFQASATVLLTGEGATTIEDVSEQGPPGVSEIAIENAQQVLRSQRLADRVSGELRLWEDERLLAERPSGLAVLVGRLRGTLRAGIDLVRPAEAAEPAPAVEPDPAAMEDAYRAAGAMSVQGRLRVTRVGRSSAIVLGYEAQSPALAAEVVNAVVDAYADDVLEANQATNEQASAWLSQRLAELGSEARDAAMEAERFRAENNLVESGDGLVAVESVRQLNQEYSNALAAEATARAAVEAYDAFLAQGEAALSDPSTRGLLPVDDPRVAELRQAFDGLVARREAVVASFGEDHREALRLADEVARTSRQLFDEVVQAAAEARNDLDIAAGRLAALRETLGGAVETSAAASESLVELRAIEQRAETVSALYESMLVQAERAAQQQTLPVSDMRVLSYAEVPRSPSSPSTMRTLGLAFVLGLMAATAHAALREWRDRALRTGGDVTDALGQRFLGYLPVLRDLETAPRAAPRAAPEPGREPGTVVPAVPMPAILRPRSHFAETLRNVRLASELGWAGREGGRVIAVTSMRAGEGKSTVALNLAAVLASGGQRTLLVDADPRKADLTRRLRLGARPGLAALAMGGSGVEPFARLDGTGVEVMPCEAGQGDVAPFDLLGSPATHDFLARARRQFRCIVLDMAPLGPVVDARLLLPATDQVVMVATWGQTSRPEMAYALAHEPQVRERLIGMILNRVDMRSLARYAPPDAQHGYGSYYGTA